MPSVGLVPNGASAYRTPCSPLPTQSHKQLVDGVVDLARRVQVGQQFTWVSSMG